MLNRSPSNIVDTSDQNSAPTINIQIANNGPTGQPLNLNIDPNQPTNRWLIVRVGESQTTAQMINADVFHSANNTKIKLQILSVCKSTLFNQNVVNENNPVIQTSVNVITSEIDIQRNLSRTGP